MALFVPLVLAFAQQSHRLTCLPKLQSVLQNVPPDCLLHVRVCGKFIYARMYH